MARKYKSLHDVWAVTSRVPLFDSRSFMTGVLDVMVVFPLELDSKGNPIDNTNYLNVVYAPTGLSSHDLYALFEREGAYGFRQIGTMQEVTDNG